MGAAYLMTESASCPRGESGHQTALEMGKGGVSKASWKRQQIRWKVNRTGTWWWEEMTVISRHSSALYMSRL